MAPVTVWLGEAFRLGVTAVVRSGKGTTAAAPRWSATGGLRVVPAADGQSAEVHTAAAAPGEHTVTVTAGGLSQTAVVRVTGDRRPVALRLDVLGPVTTPTSE